MSEQQKREPMTGLGYAVADNFNGIMVHTVAASDYEARVQFVRDFGKLEGNLERPVVDALWEMWSATHGARVIPLILTEDIGA